MIAETLTECTTLDGTDLECIVRPDPLPFKRLPKRGPGQRGALEFTETIRIPGGPTVQEKTIPFWIYEGERHYQPILDCLQLIDALRQSPDEAKERVIVLEAELGESRTRLDQIFGQLASKDKENKKIAAALQDATNGINALKAEREKQQEDKKIATTAYTERLGAENTRLHDQNQGLMQEVARLQKACADMEGRLVKKGTKVTDDLSAYEKYILIESQKG